jgi:DNA-binding XRE family transcriptional regulator
MNGKELFRIRHHLAKTQSELAQLFGVSTKAMQSFEQGWRKIPAHVERQVYFLLAMRRIRDGGKIPTCWEVKKCASVTRDRCPAWEFQRGDLCWFINGTVCRGVVEKNWVKKMKTCRKCEVFRSILLTH